MAEFLLDILYIIQKFIQEFFRWIRHNKNSFGPYFSFKNKLKAVLKFGLYIQFILKFCRFMQ